MKMYHCTIVPHQYYGIPNHKRAFCGDCHPLLSLLTSASLKLFDGREDEAGRPQTLHPTQNCAVYVHVGALRLSGALYSEGIGTRQGGDGMRGALNVEGLRATKQPW